MMSGSCMVIVTCLCKVTECDMVPLLWDQVHCAQIPTPSFISMDDYDENELLLWTWQDYCTLKLIASMVAYTKPAQDQAGQHSSTKQEGVHESLHPTGKFLKVNGFWGREIQFLLRVWCLLGQPWSSGWSHTQEYMNSINWRGWPIIFLKRA